MLTYNDIVQGNGFLTDKGTKIIKETFLPVLEKILAMAHSENELRVMGSILSNLIGKTVADIVQKQYDETEHLNEMGDTEFFEHMKSKYGDFDVLTTPITPAEARRVQVYWHKKFGDLIEQKPKSASHMVDPFEIDEATNAYNKLMTSTNDAVMSILEKTKKKISNIHEMDTTTMLDEFLNKKISDNPGHKEE